MVNVRKTCQSCQYWSPVDMTLDAGARIFGTCTKIGDYRTIYEKSRHLAGGDWNKLVEQLKLELRKAVACVQSTDGDQIDRPYFRTGMDFSCGLWEGKPEAIVTPKEPSLTGKV